MLCQASGVSLGSSPFCWFKSYFVWLNMWPNTGESFSLVKNQQQMQLIKESCVESHWKPGECSRFFISRLLLKSVILIWLCVCRTRQHFCQQFTLAKDSSQCLIFRPAFVTLAVFYVQMTSPLAFAFLFYWFLLALDVFFFSSFPSMCINIVSFLMNSCWILICGGVGVVFLPFLG